MDDLIPYPLCSGAGLPPAATGKDQPILPIAFRLYLVCSGKEAPIMDKRLAFVIS